MPPPHLFSGRSAKWPSSYNSQSCSLGSSPALKSPQPGHTYTHHVHESPMSSHDINNLPTNGCYDPSITASDYQVRLVYRSILDSGLTRSLHSTLDMSTTRLLTDPPSSFLHPHLHFHKQHRYLLQQHKSTYLQELYPQYRFILRECYLARLRNRRLSCSQHSTLPQSDHRPISKLSHKVRIPPMVASLFCDLSQARHHGLSIL